MPNDNQIIMLHKLKSEINLLRKYIKVWIRYKIMNTENSILKFLDNFTQPILKVFQSRKEQQSLRFKE